MGLSWDIYRFLWDIYGILWDFMGFFNGILQWDDAHFGCFMRLWEEPRIWEITENIEGSVMADLQVTFSVSIFLFMVVHDDWMRTRGTPIGNPHR